MVSLQTYSKHLPGPACWLRIGWQPKAEAVKHWASLAKRSPSGFARVWLQERIRLPTCIGGRLPITTSTVLKWVRWLSRWKLRGTIFGRRFRMRTNNKSFVGCEPRVAVDSTGTIISFLESCPSVLWLAKAWARRVIKSCFSGGWIRLRPCT